MASLCIVATSLVHCEAVLPAPDVTKTDPPDNDPRTFVLRIRVGHGAAGQDVVVTVDDVRDKRKTHFTGLEAAFAEIRRALNLPGAVPGRPH